MIFWSSYLHNGGSFTVKMIWLYWIRTQYVPQCPCWTSCVPISLSQSMASGLPQGQQLDLMAKHTRLCIFGMGRQITPKNTHNRHPELDKAEIWSGFLWVLSMAYVNVTRAYVDEGYLQCFIPWPDAEDIEWDLMQYMWSFISLLGALTGRPKCTWHLD